jgi:hypothetical protein
MSNGTRQLGLTARPQQMNWGDEKCRHLEKEAKNDYLGVIGRDREKILKCILMKQGKRM